MTEAENFAWKVASMPAELQNKFFSAIKETLGEEDCQTVMKAISVMGLFRSPAKYNAMKEAVKATLIEELYGHEYNPDDYYHEKEDFNRTGYYAMLPGIHR